MSTCYCASFGTFTHYVSIYPNNNLLLPDVKFRSSSLHLQLSLLRLPKKISIFQRKDERQHREQNTLDRSALA